MGFITKDERDHLTVKISKPFFFNCMNKYPNGLICHKVGLEKFNKLGLHIHESNFSEPSTSLVHNQQTEITLVWVPLWQRHQCRGHPYVCLLNQENERLLRYGDDANRKYYHWRLRQTYFFKKMFSHFCPFFGFSIVSALLCAIQFSR